MPFSTKVFERFAEQQPQQPPYSVTFYTDDDQPIVTYHVSAFTKANDKHSLKINASKFSVSINDPKTLITDEVASSTVADAAITPPSTPQTDNVSAATKRSCAPPSKAPSCCVEMHYEVDENHSFACQINCVGQCLDGFGAGGCTSPVPVEIGITTNDSDGEHTINSTPRRSRRRCRRRCFSSSSTSSSSDSGSETSTCTAGLQRIKINLKSGGRVGRNSKPTKPKRLRRSSVSSSPDHDFHWEREGRLLAMMTAAKYPII